MSAPMQLPEWVDATASNYLEDFVPAGGAAVKFAVAMVLLSYHPGVRL